MGEWYLLSAGIYGTVLVEESYLFWTAEGYAPEVWKGMRINFYRKMIRAKRLIKSKYKK